MSQTEPGNLAAFTNFKKQAGDKLPSFTGKITLPGSDAERGISLWPTISKKTGAVVISGRVELDANEQILQQATNAPAVDADKAIEIMQTDGKGLKIDPNTVILFVNKSKADNPKRPDYFGYFNAGKGVPLMRLSAWSRTDRNGKAYLSGTVQKDEPRRTAKKDKDDDEPEPSVREPEAKRERRGGRGR